MKEDIILNLAKINNGIITTKEVVSKNINTVFLTRLVKNKKLERVKKGLYVLPFTWGDEYFNLIYGNNAVFSYETSLYFLNLCESVPSEYHITVERGYNGSLRKIKKVKLHFVKKELFDIGIIEIKSPQGQLIRCYNAERCICDLLKDKDNQDIETIKYALKEYLKDKNERNIPLLLEYAERFNVLDTIQSILFWI